MPLRRLLMGLLLFAVWAEPAAEAGEAQCSVAIEPREFTVLRESGAVFVAVETAADCEWTATVSEQWLCLTSPVTGQCRSSVTVTGSATIRVGHFLNTVGQTLTATISFGSATLHATKLNIATTGQPFKSTPRFGATAQPTALALTWHPVNATSYRYCVDTTDNRLCDTEWVPVQGTQAFVTGLLPATTYYWQVEAIGPGGIGQADSTLWFPFTTASARAAMLTAPAAETTVVGPRLTVEWEPGSGASAYWLDVATENGFLYSNYQGLTFTRTLTGLPQDGRPVSIRLWSLVGGVWQFASDVNVVSVSPILARLTSPLEGATLPGSTARFEWDGGRGVEAYWLEVGRSQGGTDLYMAYLDTAQAVTVSQLPLDGGEVWARLYSRIDGQWQFAEDRAFTAAAPRLPRLTSPPPGTTLPGAQVRFEWEAGQGVTEYWLDIGTQPGGAELYSNHQGGLLVREVTGLPTHGGAVWVALCAKVRAAWQCEPYEYRAATNQAATITSPAPGAVLPADTVTFAWTAGAGISAFWLDVGRQPGGYDLFSNYLGTDRQRRVTGLPTTGEPVWVRLWSRGSDGWQFTDQAFTAAQPGPAQLIHPAAGSTLGPAATFGWSAGTNVEAYWLDVGTALGGYDLFSNFLGQDRQRTVTGLPVTGGPIWVRLHSRIAGTWLFVDQMFTATDGAGALAQLTSPTPGATLDGARQVFTWSPGGSATAYWLNVGTTRGGYDLWCAYYATSQSAVVSGLPADGRPIWVRLHSRVNGVWEFVDYAFRAPGS